MVDKLPSTTAKFFRSWKWTKGMKVLSVEALFLLKAQVNNIMYCLTQVLRRLICKNSLIPTGLGFNIISYTNMQLS